MPSLPNPETTMTIAGVGMVSDSFSSSSFLFLSFSFPQFRSIQKKKAIRDDSYNSFFLTPIPPNLGGAGARRRRQKRRRRKPRREKEHTKKRSRAFNHGFFYARSSPRSVFKKRRGARSCISFRSLFVFFYSFFATVTRQEKTRGVDHQAERTKNRNFYLTFVLLSLFLSIFT